MKQDKIIELFISMIDDRKLSTLSDIAKLSYPNFLHRVGNKLKLAQSHHLYQHAIYSSKEAMYRAKLLRENPQLRNITCLQNTTVPPKNLNSSEIN